MQRLVALALGAFLVSPGAFSQVPNASRAAAPAGDLPKLEKFDASYVDKTKDACTDFYQYACSKWITAHPIPSDMPVTSVVLPLFLYNQTILRNAMEKAAANKQATGSERQIGEFWTSCMDDAGRNANGKSWLQPHLKVIE